MDNITQGDLILVFWLDAESDESWTSLSTIDKKNPPLVKNVGWFVSETEDCIRLVSSISGKSFETMEATYTIIPKMVIESVEKIREDELDVE